MWSRWCRRVVPIVVGLILASTPVTVAGAAAQVDERPNIILISADDMRADDIWVMDNLRRLLTEQGTTFTNSYSPFPLCCPARASMLTGQYAHNHGVLDNAPPLGGYAAFDGSSTLATWLQDAGYLTAFVGKYLNNYGSVKPVTVPPGWADWHANVGGGHYFDTRMFENGTPNDYTKYQTDLHADMASEAITRSAAGDAPFFLWASFFAPHGGQPIEADDPPYTSTPAVAPRHHDAFASLEVPKGPSYNEADVSDKPAYVRDRGPIYEPAELRLQEIYRQRLESLLALDEAIARMMAALAATGELDNTIVAFTSDNGYMLGEHRIQAGKKVPYEGSARVPLVIRGPGFSVGETRDQLVATIDLAPTFVDAANTQPGLDVDGLSILPLAADPALRPQRALVVESGPEVVDGPWFYRGIRTDQWLYLEYEATGEIEMYDMVNDRDQLQSLHADPGYDAQRAMLAQRLSMLRDCAGSDCRAGPPGEISDPTITSVSPPARGQGTNNRFVRIIGTDLGPDAAVSVIGGGVTVISRVIVSPTEMYVKVSILVDALVGTRTLTVTNSDSGTTSAPFTVAPGPHPTSASPSVARGTTETVTIEGTDFVPGGTLQVRVIGSGITTSAPTAASATAITVTVTVAEQAVTGRYRVIVLNPDGGMGSCLRCLEVT